MAAARARCERAGPRVCASPRAPPRGGARRGCAQSRRVRAPGVRAPAASRATRDGAAATGPPTIDVSSLRRGAWRREGASAAERARALDEVSQAMSEWGFFNASGHGVDARVAARFEAAQRAFFALPKEHKTRVKRQADNSRGWFDDELTKQKLDWKECFDFGAQDGHLDGRSDVDGYNQWPAEPADFRVACEEYYAEAFALATDLAAAAALSLGLAEGYFDACFEKHTSYLRSNWYPLCPDTSANLGIERHTDAGFLTVLMQDSVSALQVFHDGEWTLVPPVEGAYTINVGDQLQVFSNDRYRAALHRVLASEDAERFSAPFFLNTSYGTDALPVGVADEDALYLPVNWGDFRRRRFEGDFSDQGEEVQIAHFLKSGAASRAGQ